MGVRAIAWALDQPLAGNEKVVLIALANRARDEDGVCFPGQREIARQAYVSEKTVSRILARLEEGGYLIRRERRREDGSRTSDLTTLNVGRVAPPDKMSVRHVPNGHSSVPSPPDTAVSGQNHQEEPSGSLSLERAGAVTKPVTYRRKKVPPIIVDEATRLLAVFSEVTGRRIGARTGTGDASPALKQVIGAMMARPDAEPAAWEGAIRNTAENPPGWMDGRPMQIGDVFGERAAEWALSNGGKKAEVIRARTARDPAKQERVDNFMGALGRFQGRAA